MNGLNKTAKNIQGRTICAFGKACAWAVLSFVNKFKNELEAKGAADEVRHAVKGAGPTAQIKIATSPSLG